MMQGTQFTRHEFFSFFTEDEKAALLACAHQRKYKDGDVIFKHGDEGGFLAIVQSGRVRIELYSEDGKDMLIDLVEPDSIVGEFSFLDGQSRSADAVAEGDSTLLLFDRVNFLPLLQKRPEIALHFTRHLVNMLRQNTLRLQSLSLLPLSARLARLLLQLSIRYGIETSEGIRIDDRLDQSDYGRLVASSRESVNKLLRQWQNENLIDCRKNGIVLLDVKILHTLAEDTQ